MGGFGGAWPRAHSLEDVARFPGGLYNPEDRRVLRLPSCPSSDRNRLNFQHRRLRKVAIRLSRACGLASSVGFVPVLLGARRIPKKAKKKSSELRSWLSRSRAGSSTSMRRAGSAAALGSSHSAPLRARSDPKSEAYHFQSFSLRYLRRKMNGEGV